MKQRTLPLILAILGLALILGPATTTHGASTRTVCASGCDYTTVRAAIDAASPGDTISVRSGSYTEAGIVVNKNLTIQGESATETIIQAGTNPGSTPDRVLSIASGVTATIRDLTIRNGNAGSNFGGGILNAGDLTLINSTVADNRARRGGGIDNQSIARIISSTISDNRAVSDSPGKGGGVYNAGTLELTNATISANLAINTGGGIEAASGSSTVVIHSTITANRVNGTPKLGGGIFSSDNASVSVKNSIIAGNRDPGQDSAPDCSGPITSQGYNLVGTSTGCAVSPNDKTISPGAVFTTVLGPLQNNGGNTQTHALLPGSPAIDAGDSAFTPPPFYDQRGPGFRRVADGRIDIGAFEVTSDFVVFVTNTNDSGDGSLRQAIISANNHPNAITTDAIYFAINGTEPTIQLLSPLPPITDPVIIDGYTQPGAAPNTLEVGNNAVVLVELAGSNAGSGAGLVLSTSDSTLRGLIINGFSGAGVVVSADNNQIAGNVIADNGQDGVRIENGVGNALSGNAISGNDRLGIDLGGDGVTFNHLGEIAGPNNYQNYPILTLATSDGSSTRIKGTLDSSASTTFRIELFANPTCDATEFGEGQTPLGTFQVTTDSDGRASFDQAFLTDVPEGQGVSATATSLTTNNTSEFSWCRPVATPNLNWLQARPLNPGTPEQQRIVDRFQEKWFRFPVQPGARVRVQLSSLPGSAVSLHRDPLPIYNRLITPESATVLGAETTDIAFLPSGSLPSGSLPSGSLPSGSLPSDSLFTGYLPSGSLPSGSLPSGSLPSGSLPSGSLPSGSLPSGSLPSGSLPSGSLPSGSLPSGSLPSGSLPSGSLPSGSLPEAYSGAARRSLIAISLDPDATVHTIDRNTYDLAEDLYVRVVGPYAPTTPFTLEVTVEGGVCGAIQSVPEALDVIAGSAPATGSYKTLILTDISRLPGPETEKNTALEDLQELAKRDEVAGVVIDLADVKYERVAWANAQADRNMACPTAKNLVAAEIKQVIDRYREANVGSGGKTSIEYIVLAGGPDVIPFFYVPDVAGLANEKEYVPPVKPSSASEAALQNGLVPGQDAYGAQFDISRGSYNFVVPDLAVGRLVETASDISTAVKAYIATNGVVTPGRALVTGYDFVGDAAEAIKIETDAGTGNPSDTLIQAPGLPPSDPSAWSADDLRAKLFAGKLDFAVLTGHFSAGNLLAADYRTNIAATEITTSTVDFTDIIVFTLGCHGGYTIPAVDQLRDISPEPDWAKAFLRKRAAGYIAAAAYAYGDTELIDYGERLFLDLTRQLRTGNEPVALGQALVATKRKYLAETAQITGVDEKTLVAMTLYGLPMMKVDMPGARINPPTEGSIVGAANSVTTGPGANLGLRNANATVTPAIATNTVQLTNLSDNSLVTTTYLSGTDGVVANPFEPIFPKEIYDVGVDGLVLRGIALRGGSYTDQADVIPLTAAPTTETSRPHLSYETDVFYPNQVWLPNYFDAIDGGPPRLVAVPAQFKSREPGVIDGTLRQFTDLKFQLYYLNKNWPTTGSPTVRSAAVAAAPTILGASGVPNGSTVTFSVNVQGEASAGVQAVWILYTGKSGPFYGKWQPLDLSQPDPALDPTLWEGKLTLPNGANAQDIRFMVQAVNGAGLATLSTNLGAYYPVPPLTPPSSATTLIWQVAPTSGTYLRPSSFSLLLTETTTGQPLANQRVILDLGGQKASAATDANGRATITLQPVVVPGDYTLQATFRGSADYRRSSTTNPFKVLKDSTSVTLSPQPALIQNGQPASIVASVRDSANRALGGKSVFFVVSGSGGTFARSVIADAQGNAPLGAVPLPVGTYTVNAYFSGVIPLGNGQTVTLSDDFYLPSQATVSLTLFAPPVVGAITAPVDPQPVNSTITASASFTDPDAGDTFTAVWNWGDGSTSAGIVTAANGGGTVTGSHIYTAVGVYRVTLTVTDRYGGSGQAQSDSIVIFDPNTNDRFVTGGGWINSPTGAYVADPTLTGRANFGFVARLRPGTNVPSGNTEFQFKSGNLNFRSASYDALTITGAKAQFKGTGTRNGASGYRFTLTVIDGQVSGGGGTDKFRIKILDPRGAVIYDTQAGAPDNTNPTTVLSGGSIQIKK